MEPLPFTPLVGSAFASVGQSTYVFGGYECSQGSPTPKAYGWTEDNKRQIKQYATAWRYDFTTDTWTQLADFPGTASGWCAAPYKNTIVLLGGGIMLDLHGVKVPYRTNYILEPGTPRQRLIGTYSDLVFVYDIKTNSYKLMENQLPIGTNDLRCTISGNTIYAAGGETVDAPLSNCIDAFMIGTIEE